MTKKKHEELVGEITEALGGICDPMASYHPSKEEYLRDVARTFITLTVSAVRDGKVEILCPECNEPIKVLKCEGCHLENVDGYIRH